MSFVHFREWHEIEPEIEKEWKAKFEPMGIRWDTVKDAVRFGWDAASLPEYQGKRFKSIENDLAAHWFIPEQPAEEDSWDYVRDAVELGYEKSRANKHSDR